MTLPGCCAPVRPLGLQAALPALAHATRQGQQLSRLELVHAQARGAVLARLLTGQATRQPCAASITGKPQAGAGCRQGRPDTGRAQGPAQAAPVLGRALTGSAHPAICRQLEAALKHCLSRWSQAPALPYISRFRPIPAGRAQGLRGKGVPDEVQQSTKVHDASHHSTGSS